MVGPIFKMNCLFRNMYKTYSVESGKKTLSWEIPKHQFVGVNRENEKIV